MEFGACRPHCADQWPIQSSAHHALAMQHTPASHTLALSSYESQHLLFHGQASCCSRSLMAARWELNSRHMPRYPWPCCQRCRPEAGLRSLCCRCAPHHRLFCPTLGEITVFPGAGLVPAFAPRPTVPPLPPPFSQQVAPGVVRHFNIQPNHKMLPDAMSMTVEHISNGQHSFQRAAPPTFELPPGGLFTEARDEQCDAACQDAGAMLTLTCRWHL